VKHVSLRRYCKEYGGAVAYLNMLEQEEAYYKSAEATGYICGMAGKLIYKECRGQQYVNENHVSRSQYKWSAGQQRPGYVSKKTLLRSAGGSSIMNIAKTEGYVQGC
jgi:hypothetical protein